MHTHDDRFHITIAADARLSNELYFEKKIARFRRAATRPPFKIVNPKGSRIVADHFFDMFTFVAKFAQCFGPQDKRMAHLTVRVL